MRIVIAYLKYLWRCNGRHGIHSPFVYDLLENNLYKKQEIDCSKPKNIRKTALADKRPLHNDYGTNAGAFSGMGSIAEMARKASIPHKYGLLLVKLVKHFNPSLVVEMGTCMGLSSSYMAMATDKVLSCEGNPVLAETAKTHLRNQEIDNVEVVNKSFANFIQEDLAQLPSIPFLYLDGDHSYEATLDYFLKLLPKADHQSVWVFDDIYWSTGMTKAWEEIKKHPNVTLSLDFFKFGVLFFKPVKQKQHFTIWY